MAQTLRVDDYVPSSNRRIGFNIEKVAHAFTSLGYSFEQAVADLLDNSIDAGASNVLIRLQTCSDGRVRLIIADDGDGMNRKTLIEAMRMGSGTGKDPNELGKFGMGLKLASLSQTNSLTVASRCNGYAGALRWTEDGLANNCRCDVFSASDSRKMISMPLGRLSLARQGTVVIWANLDKMSGNGQEIVTKVEKLKNRLMKHIGLHFHRFLSRKGRKRLQVWIDIQEEGADETGITREVKPLNPFGYKQPGKKGFPCTFNLSLEGAGKCKLEAHIWPPNSEMPEYRLPGGANSRQGFYFYRNDRLIQAGGWNGMRETDPHRSLARVAIDLPASMDSCLSLDVKKVSLQLPPEFNTALGKCQTAKGVTFPKYITTAELVYRKKAQLSPKDMPLVMGKGTPKSLRKLSGQLFGKDAKHLRSIAFEWVYDLHDDIFFLPDRDDDVIQLNASYRTQVLNGLRGSATDAAMVKTLLFLLSQDVLRRERDSKKQTLWLAQCNILLVNAVKAMRIE